MRPSVLPVFGSAALASDRPLLSPDQPAAAVVTSRISATAQFSLATLDRALERKIPRRLVSFNDRETNCWHRRILGRTVNVDCTYSGYVERTGAVSLRAERGRLIAAAPLFGSVSGQGVRGLARMVHGSAQGDLVAYASARPQLRPDWSVSLDMGEGFHWQEPPVLQILGFRIDLQRYVDPAVKRQLWRVGGDVAAEIRRMSIKAKADAAWKQAFANVKLTDTPAIWLQTTPQSVAFSGVRAEGDVLEGAIEISGNATTVVGAEPAAPTPSPLPPLAEEVADPGRFEIIVPVTIGYEAIRQKVEDVLAKQAELNLASHDIEIYPSAGNLVIGVRVGQAMTNVPGGDWIFLTATPQGEAESQGIQLTNLSVAGDTTPDPAKQSTPQTANVLQALKRQFSVGYQVERDRIIASANERLSRPLGDGFRSEGKLTSAGVRNIELLADGMRINLRAEGHLKLIYGS